jgi:hypothetical protein
MVDIKKRTYQPGDSVDGQPEGHVRGLTINERLFVVEITREDSDRPTSATDAYRRVYTAGGKPNTVHNQAAAIMRRPNVVAAIEAAHARSDAERSRRLKTTRTYIENGLMKEIATADKASDRINALKALHAMLPDENKEVEEADTPIGKESILTRIRDLMSSSGGDPLDITPEHVIDDESEDSCSNEHEDLDRDDDMLPVPIEVEAKVMPS